MIQRKPITEEAALVQLASMCSQAEHCSYEMLEKMRRWQLSEEAQARIMERLMRERYIDDERYARAFVADKIKYNKWGRRKVEQALWQKHIDEDVRRRVLDAVPETDYLAVLRPLLQQKRRTTKASSDYELQQKLVRFALSRGFDFSQVRQCMEVDVDEDEFLE